MSPVAKGISLKLSSTLAFALMVTLIKLVSDQIPPGEVLFARAFFGMVPVLVMLMVTGTFPRALRTRNKAGHIKRALVGTTSMFCWFASIVYLPLPDTTAINYSSPLFAVLFAALLLGERVRTYRYIAVAVGFVGVMIVLSEHLSDFSGIVDEGRRLGAVLSLFSAVFAALAMITVRELTATESTAAIVFYFSASATVMSFITLPFGWVIPTGTEALILIAAGLFGGIGQLLMTTAYRYAEASVIAPFDYANMIWITTLSYAVFADVPSNLVFLGSAIVIGSGIFVFWRERR